MTAPRWIIVLLCALSAIVAASASLLPPINSAPSGAPRPTNANAAVGGGLGDQHLPDIFAKPGAAQAKDSGHQLPPPATIPGFPAPFFVKSANAELSMSLVAQSNPTTADRFMTFAPHCDPSDTASAICAKTLEQQKQEGLVLGGEVGKWNCIAMEADARSINKRAYHKMTIEFTSAASKVKQSMVVYTRGGFDHAYGRCFGFHAIPFKSYVSPPWDESVTTTNRWSPRAEPDASGRMYPGWEPEHNDDTAFCFAFEFESTFAVTKEILNYFRAPTEHRATTAEQKKEAETAWKQFSLEEKAKIMGCKAGKGADCADLVTSVTKRNADLGKVAKSFVNAMSATDFESVVRCEFDCRSVDALPLPECEPLFANGPVLSFAAAHLHQEVTSPNTFEIAHSFCEKDFRLFSKQVKCMDSIFGQGATSMHLHCSMQPSPDTQQTKAAAALMIFFGDILFAGKLRDDTNKPFMSSPSKTHVDDLFKNIDKGFLLVEGKNHNDGSAWGFFKKARVAVRAHLYGPNRFGFELRAGTLALQKLSEINHKYKSFVDTQVAHRVEHGGLSMMYHLCYILGQPGFGPTTPVRLLQMPLLNYKPKPAAGPTPPPFFAQRKAADYNINMLYQNVDKFRNVGNCFTPSDPCPFEKPQTAYRTEGEQAVGCWNDKEMITSFSVALNDIWIKGTWHTPAPEYKIPTTATSFFNTARHFFSTAGLSKAPCDATSMVTQAMNLYKPSSKPTQPSWGDYISGVI